MSTSAKMVEFRRDLAALEKAKREPDKDKKKLRPRDKIRIRMRCRLCGRPRAVYRKFGICRICFRGMASNGLIPGVQKASWQEPNIMMTDPIADMLTRIRNGNRIELPAVDMPSTHLKERIAQVLKDEGFILDFQVGQLAENEGKKTFQTPANADEPKKILRVFLKFGPEGERVIRHIQRASKPGLRIYRSYKKLRPVLDGLGIAILSTSRGVLSDRQARTQRLGGELLCTVW